MVATAKIPQRQLFIDGEWSAPALGRRLPVINPTTEASIGEIPAGTSEDMDAAAAAAQVALKKNRGRDWSRGPKYLRAKCLRAIAAKKFRNRCRKPVGMLGCAISVDVHVPGPSILASSSHVGRGSSSCAASSSRIVEENEEEEDDEVQVEGEEEGGGEEEYDEEDGPPLTQPTQKKRGKQPKKQWKSPSSFLKERPRRRTTTQVTRYKSNEERAAKKGRK